jgi:Ca2+-binding RTX toxin-like protein
MNGTKKNDNMTGSSGADTIAGGAGKDIIKGGASADMLYGAGGKDFLYGGDGNDVLKGGGGQDSLTGGGGADQFVFRSAEGFAPVSFTGGKGITTVWQWVIVTDLNFAEGDNVRLTGFDDIFGTQNDGITFLLNDAAGNTQALTLNGIHPDSIMI